MSVLVTGGAGFIGSHLVKRLCLSGDHVRVADNFSRGRRENLNGMPSNVEIVAGDLTDPQFARHVSKDVHTVFHLAGKVGGLGYYLEHASEVYIHNVLVDQNVIDAAVANGVRRFFYASSAHVYPSHLQRSGAVPLKEEDALHGTPALSYGKAKLEAERRLELEASLNTAVARITGAYGDGQDIDLKSASAIPAFCRRALEYPRTPFRMIGDGRERRSYCFIDDVVEGILLLTEKSEENGKIAPVNLGVEGTRSIFEIARTIIAETGKEIPILTSPADDAGISDQAIDVALLRKVLPEWRPRVDLGEGVRRVLADVRLRLLQDTGSMFVPIDA